MLSYIEIEKFLLKNQFEILNETSKKIAMRSQAMSYPVYLNKTAGNASSSLIIHPGMKDTSNALSEIPDVIHSQDGWYHSSNMTLFPKRMNNGKNPIGYGVPFGFKSENALKKFLSVLKSSQYEDNPLKDIEAAKDELSRENETTRDALIKSRIGQGPFRDKLKEYWGGCAVTGCNILEMLIASHAKPWRDSSNTERLDPYNGLLLTPNLDKAFDKGYISFDKNGSVLISQHASIDALKILGIDSSIKLSKISPNHLPYLEWHNNHIFKK